MDTESYAGIWLLLLSVIVVSIAVAWAKSRWSKLQPELFPPTDEATQDEEEAATRHKGASSDLWLKNVSGLLAGVGRALEREKTPEAQTLLEATRKLEAAAPELPAAVRSVVIKAAESGELGSLLLGKDGLYAYVVAVPNRHEHPHLIRRYAPFSAGWAGHAELVRDSLASSGDFSAMLAYLFFLSPDATDGVLLVSYASPEMLLVPSRLLQGSQSKSGNCKAVDAAIEFKMSD
jgi:hypothetical protein